MGFSASNVSDHELFDGLSTSEKRQVEALGTSMAIDEGREIISQGRLGRQFIAVLEGQGTITHDGVPVAQVSAGHWVGELALRARARGEDARRSFSVTAATPMTIAVFSQQEYHELLQVSPVIADRIEAEAKVRERRTDRLVAEAATFQPDTEAVDV